MHVEAVAQPGSEWDAFVSGQAGASLGHASAWARVMREAYGVDPHYLAVRDSARIAAVLPLVRVPTLRGGAELVSMPYLDAGGILGPEPEAARLLLDAACEHAAACGASAVELRQLGARPGLEPEPAPAPGPELDRVNLVLALAEDEDALWAALPAKVRNQTRKARREGLHAWVAGAEACEGFYQPFRVNMRDLGTPVHARRFYECAARAFGDALRFVVALDGERAVGGLVAIHTGERVTVTWAATLRAERPRCPNNLIYWEALRWAVGRGARWFDFGRSPRESGTHRFKRGWGAEEEPLAWLRYAPTGERLPLEPPGASPLLRGLSRAWTRLPLALADRLGPPLRRRLSS